MKCERCAERPAKLKYTELREGETRTMWICDECARELGFGDTSEIEPGEPVPEVPETPAAEAGSSPESPTAGLEKFVLEMLKAKGITPGEEEDEPLPGDEYASVRCPGCGITGAHLRERTLLGCPQCYETFERPLDDLLLRLHGALDHKGRLPGGREAVPPDPEELHRQLREAIDAEDFETAARLRDRLRRIRGREP